MLKFAFCDDRILRCICGGGEVIDIGLTRTGHDNDAVMQLPSIGTATQRLVSAHVQHVALLAHDYKRQLLDVGVLYPSESGAESA